MSVSKVTSPSESILAILAIIISKIAVTVTSDPFMTYIVPAACGAFVSVTLRIKRGEIHVREVGFAAVQIMMFGFFVGRYVSGFIPGQQTEEVAIFTCAFFAQAAYEHVLDRKSPLPQWLTDIIKESIKGIIKKWL